MKRHIYAYGSICRGEITRDSDIDLLAVVDCYCPELDPQKFSIYSVKRLNELWREGSPFAWHLHKESVLLYSSDGTDALCDLGIPQKYVNAERDCHKFHVLFLDALKSFEEGDPSRIFDLSAIFLATRNFATCYMLGVHGTPIFSRDSAMMMGQLSVPLTRANYRLLVRARLLATRGAGEYIDVGQTQGLLPVLNPVNEWMTRLRNDAFGSARI